MLPPLLYLVHFYYVISNSQRPVGINEKDEPGAHLPHTAQSYVDVIITAGASVLIYGVSPWQSRTGNRSTLGERELAERAASRCSAIALNGCHAPSARSASSTLVHECPPAGKNLIYPNTSANGDATGTLWRCRRVPPGPAFQSHFTADFSLATSGVPSPVT